MGRGVAIESQLTVSRTLSVQNSHSIQRKPGKRRTRLPICPACRPFCSEPCCSAAWPGWPLRWTKFRLALIINAGIADLLGEKGSTTNYADALFVVLCMLLAAGIGVGVGSSLRAITVRAHEAELQRHLNETKGKIPQLESGMRNREMQVARVEQQMKDLEGSCRRCARRSKSATWRCAIATARCRYCRSEVALLKGTPLASEAASSAMATLDLDDDTFTTSQRVEPRNDAAREALEERVRELETKVREREARIAELMYETGNHAKQIPQLESALDGQRKKNQDYDRERQRQEKWLDVSERPARARPRNQRPARGRTARQRRAAAAHRRTRSRSEAARATRLPTASVGSPPRGSSAPPRARRSCTCGRRSKGRRPSRVPSSARRRAHPTLKRARVSGARRRTLPQNK